MVECLLFQTQLVFMSKDASLSKMLHGVREFHDAFGIENADTPRTDIGQDQIELRHRLMEEENNEYLEAALEGDLTGVADALGDQLYILCGTLLKHGMQDVIADVFDAIQESNMSKLDVNGNPIYREDGKVLKSDLYFPPRIAEVLDQFRSRTN